MIVEAMNGMKHLSERLLDSTWMRRKERRGKSRKPTRQLRTYSKSIAIGLGGGGAQGLISVHCLNPGAPGSLMAVDTDIKTEADLHMISDVIYLGRDCDLGDILEHRDLYTYLRGEALPESMEAWRVAQGVGMVRVGATVLLGFDLDMVKLAIRRMLERVLGDLEGPLPKKLIINLIFSPGGGTGSSLAIPVAALFRDCANEISSALTVEVVAHVISPQVFLSQMSTPDEQERNLANAYMTYLELLLAQNPAYLLPLCESLGIAPLSQPLFDEIIPMEQADSGNCVQKVDEIGRRIAANIVASQDHALGLLEGSRKANPAAAQRGRGFDQAGTAVIGSCVSKMLYVPTDRITQVYAANVMAKRLREVGDQLVSEVVTAAERSGMPKLGIEGARRRINERLTPDESHSMPFVDKMSNAEAADLGVHTLRRWTKSGRSELHRKCQASAEEAKTQAALRVKTFLEATLEKVQGLPEHRAVIDRAVDAIEKAQAAAQREHEGLAGLDTMAPYRKDLAVCQEGSRLRLRKRRARRALRRDVERIIQVDMRIAVLDTYCQYVLEPTLEMLKAAAHDVDRVEQIVLTCCQQIEWQAKDQAATIGYADEYCTELPAPAQATGVLERLGKDVEAQLGPQGELDLRDLLATRGEDDLQAVIETVAEKIEAHAKAVIDHSARDLQGFVEHFELAFDVDNWVEQGTEITLPSRLRLAVNGPGQAPTLAYLVAPESMRSTCLDVLADQSGRLGFEFVSGRDGYKIIMRLRISRVAFASIPSLGAMGKAYESFRTANDSSNDVWATLHSHGALAKAKNLSLLRPASRRPAESGDLQTDLNGGSR